MVVMKSYVLPNKIRNPQVGQLLASPTPIAGRHTIELPVGAAPHHLCLSPAHKDEECGYELPVIWCSVDPTIGAKPYDLYIYRDDEEIKVNAKKVSYCGALVYPYVGAYHVFLGISPKES